jgi:GxxExxY protein
MNADSKRLGEISERVIGCAFTVANTLGAGFLEKVYENALAHELSKLTPSRSLPWDTQPR